MTYDDACKVCKQFCSKIHKRVNMFVNLGGNAYLVVDFDSSGKVAQLLEEYYFWGQKRPIVYSHALWDFESVLGTIEDEYGKEAFYSDAWFVSFPKEGGEYEELGRKVIENVDECLNYIEDLVKDKNA